MTPSHLPPIGFRPRYRIWLPSRAVHLERLRRSRFWRCGRRSGRGSEGDCDHRRSVVLGRSRRGPPRHRLFGDEAASSLPDHRKRRSRLSPVRGFRRKRLRSSPVALVCFPPGRALLQCDAPRGWVAGRISRSGESSLFRGVPWPSAPSASAATAPTSTRPTQTASCGCRVGSWAGCEVGRWAGMNRLRSRRRLRPCQQGRSKPAPG